MMNCARSPGRDMQLSAARNRREAAVLLGALLYVTSKSA